MNKEEFKFLVINTKALWEEGVGELDRINITAEGISLEETYPYIYADTFLTEYVEPVSLALDPCGVLFILDKLKETILIFDIKIKKSYWVDCLSFPEPKSITISNSDVYIVYKKKIACLSRVNYQTKWEKEITEDIRIARYGKYYLYILNRESKKVFKTGREWKLEERNQINLKDKDGSLCELDNPVDIAADKRNNIYILEADKRIILKFAPNGEFIEIIPITYEEGFTPLALAADIQGNIFISFKDESTVLHQKKIKKYEISGVYITKALDSTIPDCHWHKFVLEAVLPESTQVKISHYASDEQVPPDTNSPAWSRDLVNPKDALILDAKGRNIWFKLELVSDDLNINSPLIKSLKAYFPRLSYLRYLPATYQEDSASKNFLERFLSLFETFFGNLEVDIRDVPRFFDIKATPKEFLSWLSAWVGAAWDENWEEGKWREFLSRAVQLYKQRGTRKGLSEIIKIYTDEYPIIVEKLQLRCASKEMEKILEGLYGSDPYTFCVLLKPGQIKKEAEKNTVKRIIDTEKPAHTCGGLQVLQPWIILGAHSYLEVNSFLTKPAFVLGKAVLPIDSILEDIEEAGQIERRSRIEIDTYIP